MAPNVKKSVLAYASIAFILLGVLFGMNIMTFIFGSLTPDVAGLPQTGGSVINESDLTGPAVFANRTGYTLNVANGTFPGYTGLVVTAVWNSSSQGAGNGGFNITVPTTNVSISGGGVLLNATNAEYTNVSVSYTFSYDAGARLTAVNIQNESLASIETYANASDTQFSTISIAIILVILISLFLLFWTYFMGGGSGARGERSSGNFS